MKKIKEIRKRDGSRAYELNIPVHILKMLGWLPLKGDVKKIKVSIIPDYISKKRIIVELDDEPEEGFSFKRLSLYKKGNQIERKSYKKRMKNFKQKIKEKQIDSGMIEDYRKQLEEDKVYMVSNKKRKKINKNERLKQLQELGDD